MRVATVTGIHEPGQRPRKIVHFLRTELRQFGKCSLNDCVNCRLHEFTVFLGLVAIKNNVVVQGLISRCCQSKPKCCKGPQGVTDKYGIPVVSIIKRRSVSKRDVPVTTNLREFYLIHEP